MQLRPNESSKPAASFFSIYWDPDEKHKGNYDDGSKELKDANDSSILDISDHNDLDSVQKVHPLMASIKFEQESDKASRRLRIIAHIPGGCNCWLLASWNTILRLICCD